MVNKYDPHVAVSGDETEVLLQRLIPSDLAATQWPGRDPLIADSPAVAALCTRIRDTLRHGPGFVILRLAPGLVSDPSALKVAYWNLFTSLGPPLAQYSSGEMIFEVEVAAAAAAPIYSHYSRTNRGGGFHTDGTFLPQTPFYAGLICLRQADHGGETILIDGRRLCRELALKHGAALERLGEDFYFDCCGQWPGLEYRPLPIISRENSSLLIRYLRTYIVEGHAKAGVPLDARAVASLDTLDELLDAPEFQHVYRLAPGEMLVFNNYIMLHGRRPFSDEGGGPSRRLMIRVYAGEEGEGSGPAGKGAPK